MDDFKLIVLSAGFISIVIALFENIFPSERFAKQLKLIFSLIIVLTVVNPLLNNKTTIDDFSDFKETSTAMLTADTNKIWDYFTESVENNISTDIGSSLSENNIFFNNIKTSINISETASISINEIEITVENTVQEGEIIELVKEKLGEDIFIKIVECNSDEQ